MEISPQFLTVFAGSPRRAADILRVHTEFEIGRRIVEQEQRGRNRAEYGKAILAMLASGLTAEFRKGFSETNLKLMRLVPEPHTIIRSAQHQRLSPDAAPAIL